jgi:hypothetical protein
VPNLDNVIERMKEIHDKFDKEAGLKSKDRFYSACFAAAFTGAEIANRLGLIKVPIEPIWEWALGLVTTTRATIRKSSIVNEDNKYEEIISRYWNEKHQHILAFRFVLSFLYLPLSHLPSIGGFFLPKTPDLAF